MHSLNKQWNCYQFAICAQFIAALGTGVTIYRRDNLQLVHHFSGIRYIHGGTFLNDDVLAVFTGEQKLFFLGISDKTILWECPRPKQTASAGNMQCCRIGNTNRLACIYRGKNFGEHYLSIINWTEKTCTTHQIHNCYRVVKHLMWTAKHGLIFLSYQAAGENESLCYSMNQIVDDGNIQTIQKWISSHEVIACAENYLFLANYKVNPPHLLVHKYPSNDQNIRLETEQDMQLTVPNTEFKSPFAQLKRLLPDISWADEEKGLLIAHFNNWVGIFDFTKNKQILQYDINNIQCSTIIDNRLLVGCIPGVFVEQL